MTHLKSSTAILAETDPDEQAFAVDELARDRDGWRDAYYAERKRHDATRHALARIVNGTSAHDPHDGLSLTDCRDIARKALRGE